MLNEPAPQVYTLVAQPDVSDVLSSSNHSRARRIYWICEENPDYNQFAFTQTKSTM